MHKNRKRTRYLRIKQSIIATQHKVSIIREKRLKRLAEISAEIKRLDFQRLNAYPNIREMPDLNIYQYRIDQLKAESFELEHRG